MKEIFRGLYFYPHTQVRVNEEGQKDPYKVRTVGQKSKQSLITEFINLVVIII